MQYCAIFATFLTAPKQLGLTGEFIGQGFIARFIVHLVEANKLCEKNIGTVGTPPEIGVSLNIFNALACLKIVG